MEKEEIPLHLNPQELKLYREQIAREILLGGKSSIQNYKYL